MLSDLAFWATTYGHALAWKLTGVAGMVAVSAVHDPILGSRPDETSREWASWLARLNALLGIGVVVAAVNLARSG